MMSEQAPWGRRGLEAGSRQNLRHSALHGGRAYCVLYVLLLYVRMYVGSTPYSVLHRILHRPTVKHTDCASCGRVCNPTAKPLFGAATHRTEPHRTALHPAAHRTAVGRDQAHRDKPPLAGPATPASPMTGYRWWWPPPPTPQTEVCPRRLLIGRGSWHLAACCSPLPAGGVQLRTLWGLEPPRAWIVWRMGLPWHPGHTGHPEVLNILNTLNTTP